MSAMPRMRTVPALPCVLAAVLALGGCGREVPPQKAQDPAIASALADPIMTDIDLAGQNRVDDALSGHGLPDGSLPPLVDSPEDVAAARDEAKRLAGGTIRIAPRIEGSKSSGTAMATPAQLAAGAGMSGGACSGGLQYGAIWAARLPSGLDIYPRGHVLDAAGADRQDCALRIVRYASPVPANEIADFYFTRLPRSKVRGDAGGTVLSGRGERHSYVIAIRRRSDGLSEIELVSRGG